MKKKFLALALAAAVMAPTTSVFAQTTQSVGGVDTQTYNANITINGTVNRADGLAPEGKIEVEMPTTASFTVDQKGNFIGSRFTVNNRGVGKVKLSVASFSEEDPSGKITIKKDLQPDQVESTNRDVIRLQLDATSGGVNTTVDLDTSVTDEDLVSIAGGGTATVQVLGLAGKAKSSANESTGVTENFTVTFKVEKDNS